MQGSIVRGCIDPQQLTKSENPRELPPLLLGGWGPRHLMYLHPCVPYHSAATTRKSDFGRCLMAAPCLPFLVPSSSLSAVNGSSLCSEAHFKPLHTAFLLSVFCFLSSLRTRFGPALRGPAALFSAFARSARSGIQATQSLAVRKARASGDRARSRLHESSNNA